MCYFWGKTKARATLSAMPTQILTLLLALLWFLRGSACAQNLIPNPDFEAFGGDSLAPAMDSVRHWFNPCINRQKAPYATPDFIFLKDPKSKSNYEPLHGHGMCGFITYWGRLYNYREYLSVKLIEPLQPGQKYEVAFFISNGKGEGFSSAATNGLGVLFTTDRPTQRRYEVLQRKPQFITQEVIYTHFWRKVSAQFKADSAYQYLTIGGFLSDREAFVSTYRDTDDLQAYYFIDQVSLRALETAPPKAELQRPDTATAAPVSSLPQPRAYLASLFIDEQPQTPAANLPPESLEGRPVYRQSRWQTSQQTLTAVVWDSEDADGDRVSLKINDTWICQDQLITSRKQKFQFQLQPNNTNYLILFANSLGTSPPCTVTILLKSKKESKKVTLRSDLGKCGAIEIKHAAAPTP